MKQEDKKIKRLIRRSYLISTISIAMVLFLLGTATYIMNGLLQATNTIRENVAMNIMLNNNSEQVYDSLKTVLKASDEVKKVRLISKAQAAEDFKEYVGEDFEAFLGSNPLPDSFEIMLNADCSTPAIVDSLAQCWQAWPEVMEVVYPKSTIQTVEENLKRFNVVLAMMAISLLVITLILLRNTIRMTINARRRLIDTMRLVGATRWFIMRPFLAKSIGNGLLAGVIASLMLAGMVIATGKGMPELAFVVDDSALLMVCGGMVVLGILLSLVFTAAAVNRAIRMRGGEVYIY
ncbi:MAG: permease-like cell division protein FtsX [Rikenellaceae bacterium]|nr:permease-like cell division protein FtsX [Rikenellaceae bacterium]